MNVLQLKIILQVQLRWSTRTLQRQDVSLGWPWLILPMKITSRARQALIKWNPVCSRWRDVVDVVHLISIIRNVFLSRYIRDHLRYLLYSYFLIFYSSNNIITRRRQFLPPVSAIDPLMVASRYIVASKLTFAGRRTDKLALY